MVKIPAQYAYRQHTNSYLPKYGHTARSTSPSSIITRPWSNQPQVVVGLFRAMLNLIVDVCDLELASGTVCAEAWPGVSTQPSTVYTLVHKISDGPRRAYPDGTTSKIKGLCSVTMSVTVLLQQRLPFGIKSAPGYFHEIMENLTSDLPGVAVFQDMLVSGQDANDHLSNLKRLLTHLNDKGLRCRRDKCQFAQPSVEYIGHTLSAEGISKWSKVEAVLKMPPPTDVSSLKSFLGSVRFYGKFIPYLASMAEPLYRQTKKATLWKWEDEEPAAFEQLKNVQSSDQILVHFDPNKTLVLACYVYNVGTGAVLVYCCPDGSERPIVNMSKTLIAAETTIKSTRKRCPSYLAWRSSTSTCTDVRSYWWQIINHWQHCSVQRKGRNFSLLTD